MQKLPPAIAAKLIAADMQDAEKAHGAVFGKWSDAMTAAEDCVLHLGVIAFGESEIEAEREEIIRATVVALTTLVSLRHVIEKAIPPPPRAQIASVFLQAVRAELQGVDQAVRKSLPDGVAKRAAYYAAEAEDVAVAAGSEPDHG